MRGVCLHPCSLLLAASGRCICFLVTATVSPQTGIHGAAVKYGGDQHEANGGLEPGGHRNSRQESELIHNYRHHPHIRSNEHRTILQFLSWRAPANRASVTLRHPA